MTGPDQIGKEAASGAVTVLIAVYNGEETLRRALDSVLHQTTPPRQTVVIDDGSTDSTAELVATEYAGRVTLLRQENGGVSRARNHGLQVATGEYIAMLDADDWWVPEKLEKQVAVLDTRPDVLAVYTGLVFVHEDTGAEEVIAPFPARKLWPQLRWENPAIAPSTMLVRRSALLAAGGFDESLRTSEDWDLWFRMHRLGPFAEINESLTIYQLSWRGISGDADRMFASFEAILERTLLNGLEGVRRTVWRKRIISYQAFKASLTARGAGDTAKERSYMWRSLREWPSPFWIPKRFKYFAVTLMRT